MALIKCPECGKEVSSQAVACPHCGCPIAASPKEAASPSEPQPASTPPAQLDKKWEQWGAQQASAPSVSAPEAAPAQPSAGLPQKQEQGSKAAGCLVIIVVVALIAWIGNMGGCNKESVWRVGPNGATAYPSLPILPPSIRLEPGTKVVPVEKVSDNSWRYEIKEGKYADITCTVVISNDEVELK